MSSRLHDLLAEKGRLVADGGMGTSLFELGLKPGGTPEEWNVTDPELVAKVHQGFVEAGSDIILTNTFGGTRARLDLDGKGDRVREFSAAGVNVARSIADAAERAVLVAGSVGPTGQLFEPMGPLTHESAVELFAEQMEALVVNGADIIWIETLSSTEELAAAVEAAQGFDLPIVTTFSFDTHGSTMMGVPPSGLAGWWQTAEGSPAAIGANCGIGPADVVAAVSEIRAADPDVVIVAKANCGVPQVIDGSLWYPTSSDSMSDYAELSIAAGATIIGACCGSVPDHIAEIRHVVDTFDVGEVGVQLEEIESKLGPVSAPADSGRHRERRRRARSRTATA